jgi:hypothetical protein
MTCDKACSQVLRAKLVCSLAQSLKELELENARLRKAVSDLTLDKLILKEAARGPEGPRWRNY